jgi:hypothetical protein
MMSCCCFCAMAHRVSIVRESCERAAPTNTL